MALLDEVQQHLGQNEIDQISQQLGISPSQAQSAISSALPMILGGMAGHASQPQGATAVQQAAVAHEGATANISQLLHAGPPADSGASSSGGGLLGRILGGHHDTVQQGVQQASGLDAEKSHKLLMMLAPVVLAVLAHRHFGSGNEQKANPGQLGGVLQQAAQAAAQQSPHAGGLLGTLLNAVQSHGA